MQLVPTVLGARDADGEYESPNRVLDFLAFMLFTTGAIGLISLRFDGGTLVSLAVALCIGAATGALHPEILRWIARIKIDPELEPVD